MLTLCKTVARMLIALQGLHCFGHQYLLQSSPRQECRLYLEYYAGEYLPVRHTYVHPNSMREAKLTLG